MQCVGKNGLQCVILGLLLVVKEAKANVSFMEK